MMYCMMQINVIFYVKKIGGLTLKSIFVYIAVLVLFLINIQKYPNENAIVIYHMFLVTSYILPFFGAIIADSYWGKYKTIYVLSFVYAVGNIIVSAASSITSTRTSLHFQRLCTIIGLTLTSIGAGGIKPCVSSFGGDQFVLPDQEYLLQKFFAIFYFCINAGSFLSMFITPELRQSFHCLGEDSCFPLAFGLPAVLMLIAIACFLSGKRLYTIKEPVSSVIVTSIGCMLRALKNKITAPSNEAKRNDWLEYADDKYDKNQISDLRSVLDIIFLYIPLPLYFTLNDQQGSKWILQGTLMNGKIDFLNWTLKPDQVMLINPLFILIFMPLFNVALYPVLKKIGISTPLRKITLGGLIAALSFVCTAILQYIIMVSSYFLTHKQSDDIELKRLKYMKKLRNGNPNLRILQHDEYFSNRSISLKDIHSENELSGIDIQVPSLDQNQNYEIHGIGTYNIYLDHEYVLRNVDLLPASVNDLWLYRHHNHMNAKLITLEKGKYIHLLWQVPQLLLITAAEVLFVVTLLEFSYTQAPISMKSFIAAINLSTQGLGNFLIVILSKFLFIENQVHEYILYAVFMVIAMVVFMLMSVKYKYKSMQITEPTE